MSSELEAAMALCRASLLSECDQQPLNDATTTPPNSSFRPDEPRNMLEMQASIIPLLKALMQLVWHLSSIRPPM
eukprot:scaffold33291_cov17-Prasinocladus_malaysianus.AAC.2